MRSYTVILVAAVIALSEGKLRTINLHGFGTGTVNADPLDLDFMGMPVTIGGKGQGDVKGALAVELPSSTGLEKFFGNGPSDFVQAGDFYGEYPQWMKHHSRHHVGESVYGVRPLPPVDQVEHVMAISHGRGTPSVNTVSVKSHGHKSLGLKPLRIKNPNNGKGAMYMVPLHMSRK